MTLVPSGGSNPEAKKPSKPDSRDAIWKVFKHYWGHGHPSRQPKPTGKTYRAIAARLRDGWIVEELCKSIDGYHLSPFHQGQNDRGVQYLDLELIMRDETKVQHGIEWATNPPKPGNVTSAGRDIRVGHGRAEDVHHTDVTGQVDLGALP